ncbi:MAG: helix-turn-helix transcriptional regulator [Actinomycetota bacterium]|nr:helix-turn-helix transcriptional regulator [Actinomycetota bacterium]
MQHDRAPQVPVALPRNYLHACLLLLVTEAPTHGYDLVEQLAELGLANVDSGAVYRALRTLNADGLVESWWEESDAGPARRRYRVTAAGAEALEAWGATVAASSRSLNSFLARQRQVRETILPFVVTA